jgi:peptidoglycan hydrolase-like protein with peptidoglycan-binding domain
MKKYLDLSEHNIINDYNAVVNSDLSGIILKATEGMTYKDSSFQSKYNNLKGKIKLGAYHYLKRTSSPVGQAIEFYNTIKDKELELTPWLDIEDTALADVSEEYCNAFIDKFFELSGKRPIIYTGYYYYRDNFSHEFQMNNKWWIASYGTSIKPNVQNMVGWQYTESCEDYKFISGLVDCSYVYDESLEAINQNSNVIKELQIELNKQGFTDCNGNKLIEDGIIGELTLSALPTIRKGAKGNITKFLQKQLGVSADGIFGVITEDAVLTFQYNNCLWADGIVGKNTWRKVLCI